MLWNSLENASLRPTHAGNTTQVHVPEGAVQNLYQELLVETGQEGVQAAGLPAFLGLWLRDKHLSSPLSLKHLSSWGHSFRGLTSEGATLYPQTSEVASPPISNSLPTEQYSLLSDQRGLESGTRKRASCPGSESWEVGAGRGETGHASSISQM